MKRGFQCLILLCSTLANAQEFKYYLNGYDVASSAFPATGGKWTGEAVFYSNTKYKFSIHSVDVLIYIYDNSHSVAQVHNAGKAEMKKIVYQASTQTFSSNPSIRFDLTDVINTYNLSNCEVFLRISSVESNTDEGQRWLTQLRWPEVQIVWSISGNSRMGAKTN